MANHQIWVVDRSRLFREGLKLLLKESAFEIVREIPHISLLQDGELETDRPALILMAIQDELETGSEEEAELGRICRLTGDTRVVVLSDALSLGQLKSAMKLGAAGYLLRDIAPDALAQSLLLVMLGEKVLPTDLVQILLDGSELRVPANGGPITADLSPSERRILSRLAHGRPNKVIANEMHISEGTVKVHIKAVFKKIRVRNRTEAAVWALNHGLDGEA